MPYITPRAKRYIDKGGSPMSSGELNYAITRVINRYLSEEEISYVDINTVIGALECAKLELYRRIAVPYEVQKMKENGDVYDITS